MDLVMIEKHDQNPESPRAFRVLVTRRRFVSCLFHRHYGSPSRYAGRQTATGSLDFIFESPMAKRQTPVWVSAFLVTRRRFVSCLFHRHYGSPSRYAGRQTATGSLDFIFESPMAKRQTPVWVSAFLVTRRRFELRTHCLKGSCSAC